MGLDVERGWGVRVSAPIKHRGPSVMLAVCRDKAFGVEESVGGEDVEVVFSNGGFDGIHGKLLEVL